MCFGGKIRGVIYCSKENRAILLRNHNLLLPRIFIPWSGRSGLWRRDWRNDGWSRDEGG